MNTLIDYFVGGRKVRYFFWKPKEDITALELALALRPLIVSSDMKENALDSLPENAKRHWEECLPENPD